MALDFTASTTFTRSIVNAAVRMGADKVALLKAVGLSPEILGEPESRVPSALHIPLLDEAVRMTGNDHVGLYAGEWFGSDQDNATFYGFMNCPTMGEGIRLIAKYYPALSDTARLAVNVDGPAVRLILDSIAPVPSFSRQVNEWTIAAWLSGLRLYAGDGFNPAEVRFAHACPGDISEHQRVFRAPLSFDQPHSELVLRREDMDISHPTGEHDSDLRGMLERHAQGQIERAINTDPFLTGLREEITSRFKSGAVGVREVARALGMSERALQRNLQDYGSTYSEVLEAQRKKAAANYLRDTRHRAARVGRLLGFANPGAFYKAFRRWYGTTPAEFRRRMKIEPPPDPPRDDR